MKKSIQSILNSLNFLSDALPSVNVAAGGFPLYEEESITAITATQRAVKTVLTNNKAKVRREFLAVLKVGSSQEKAIAGYVYELAYREELDPVASQEWALLPLSEQGEIQQAVRLAVFEIEGQRDVRTPLCHFSLNTVGLPESPQSWGDDSKRTRSKLDVLATTRPLPGTTRVVARAVYPLLANRHPEQVFIGVCLPPWHVFDNRKGIVDVTQGYVEAFESWVEDRDNSKLGPLTREQLFTAVNAVLSAIRGVCNNAALVAGSRLFTAYKFTLQETVTTTLFHQMLVDGWSSYPFGATALGVLNIPIARVSESEKTVRRDWILGFLSRYHSSALTLTEVERREPFTMFNLQVKDALALEDPVDRYISFNRVLIRFKGVVHVDPVDPQAGPVDIVGTYPESKKPQLPEYEAVMAWREKNLQDYSPYVGR